MYSLFKSKTLVSSSKSHWFSKGNNLPGVRLQGQGDQYKFQIFHSPGKITEPVKSPCSSVSPSRGVDPDKITSPSFLSLQPWSCAHAQVCLTLWTVAHQAPLSMGFSRQEYWSGLLFPTPKDLPNPALAGGFFTTGPPGHWLPKWTVFLIPPASFLGSKAEASQPSLRTR